MLRGEWKWLLPLKRQLLLKARKRRNVFLWKLGICESFLEVDELVMIQGRDSGFCGLTFTFRSAL